MTDFEPLTGTEIESGSGQPPWVTALSLFLAALVTRLAFLPVTNNNGTDAWARYAIAQSWAAHPNQIPSVVWLPLPFWLLGTAFAVWHSELSARIFTMLFGTLTVLPYWGVLRRVFGPRIAFWSGLLFALLGFHIAYSLTTSSEGPTIFFLVLGFYGWVRFRLGDGSIWLLPSGLGFVAGSLCRYEIWVFIPLLASLSLDFSQGPVSTWWNRHTWGQAAGFALAASGGVVGWMLFSWWKWGSPIASAKLNAWTAQYLQPHHSLIHRLVAVPGALAVTLSPLVCFLAILGLLQFQVWREPIKRVFAAMGLIMVALQMVNSVTSNLTMARFTLMYSWLLIPFAFEGLFRFSSRWPGLTSRTALNSVLLFFLLWQVGTTLGAYFAPPSIAASLSSVAPTLPLDPELRNLTAWLETHRASSDVVVIDQYNFEAVDIMRYSKIPQSHALAVPSSVDPLPIEKQATAFMSVQRPHLLVYCPQGILGTVWSLGNEDQIDMPRLNIRLHLRWQGTRYRVYEIEFMPFEQSN